MNDGRVLNHTCQFDMCFQDHLCTQNLFLSAKIFNDGNNLFIKMNLWLEILTDWCETQYQLLRISSFERGRGKLLYECGLSFPVIQMQGLVVSRG